MKLISWNVNGIRACVNKGFVDFVKDINPDIISSYAEHDVSNARDVSAKNMLFFILVAMLKRLIE